VRKLLTKNELPDCPVATVLRILNSKWKIYILQKLLERPYRFNELKNSIQGISKKVLSDSLRQLEMDKIICKKISGDKPPFKTEYFLSKLGENLRSLLKEIYDWGIFYLQHKNI